MLRDRAGTHTSKHTPTQKPHHSKSSPYDKDTGNNDELMPTTDTHLSAHKSQPDIKSVFFSIYLSVSLFTELKTSLIIIHHEDITYFSTVVANIVGPLLCYEKGEYMMHVCVSRCVEVKTRSALLSML